MEKAQCNPKVVGVITSGLHGKGLLQSQVIWTLCRVGYVLLCSDHLMSAWKRLDAIPSDLDIVQSGVPLACPLRCVPPERIVSNRAVRSLVDKLSPPAEQPARSVS